MVGQVAADEKGVHETEIEDLLEYSVEPPTSNRREIKMRVAQVSNDGHDASKSDVQAGPNTSLAEHSLSVVVSSVARDDEGW